MRRVMEDVDEYDEDEEDDCIVTSIKRGSGSGQGGSKSAPKKPRHMGLPFNAATYDSFHIAMEAVAQFGSGFKPPSMYELRVPLLKKEVEDTEDNIKNYKNEWAIKGCSILSDGWCDSIVQKDIVNFLVNSPKGSVFATSFITLAQLHKQRNNLQRMITSDNWVNSKWSKETAGKEMVRTILSDGFWRNVAYVLKLTGPLVKVLRIVDGDKKPAMGYIYEAMDRLKETKHSFDILRICSSSASGSKAYGLIDEDYEEDIGLSEDDGVNEELGIDVDDDEDDEDDYKIDTKKYQIFDVINDQLLKNMKAKFKLVATTTDKLGLPPPPQLTAFELPPGEKKRKRRDEVIHEVFLKENIVVDGMQRNLVPP
ncbi:importin subunit beta-1 [Tanacetum coccineum]